MLRDFRDADSIKSYLLSAVLNGDEHLHNFLTFYAPDS